MTNFIAPSALDDEILFERAVREYRPTIVAMLRDTNDELLLTNSSSDPDQGIWWPLQGGVEEGETPLVAMSRELCEETGIKVCPDRNTVLDSFRHRTDKTRDGYTVGKLLIGVSSDTPGSLSDFNIALNPEEIRAVRHANPREAKELMINNAKKRPFFSPKASFIIHLINNLPPRQH